MTRFAGRVQRAQEVQRGSAGIRHVADNQPLLVEDVQLPADRFAGLLDADLEHGSLYDLLARRYNTIPEYAQESVEAVALPTWAARLLDKRPGTPSLRVDLVGYDQHNRPFEYCRTLVGHRARYVVDARRGRLRGLQVVPD